MIRFVISFVIAVFLVLGAQAALASDTETLVMDNVEYDSYKHSGNAYHFETPDRVTSSLVFIIGGHVWTGHGSENLPCPGGIHWIDNKNVLTISHCLETPTTTTSLPPTTTTSTVPTTTTVPTTVTTSTVVTSTTIPPTTTTSPNQTTTTTIPTTTTSTPPGSTTTIPEVVTDVAEEGGGTPLGVYALIFGVSAFIGYKVVRKWL